MVREINSIVIVVARMLISWSMLVICDGFNMDKDGICNNIVQGRKSNDQNDLLVKILPNLAMPFLVQTMILPLVLGVMKLTLLTSMFIGKLGIFLWIINIIYNNRNPDGALYSHAININYRNNPDDQGMYPKEEGAYPKNMEFGNHGNRSRKRKK